MVRGAWIALVVLGLVGCGPAPPLDAPTNRPTSAASPDSPVAAPTPTFQCTPEAGGASVPCTEDEHDEAAARDALYERADAQYRAYLAEYIRILRAGGARELSPVLKRVLGDSELAKRALVQLRQFKSSRIHVTGADPYLAAAVRKPGEAKNDSTLALQFCVDARSLSVYRGSRKVNRLGVSRETVFFRADADGDLVIVAEMFEETESCTD